MRIGIDARELCGKPTGVGRYLAHLLASWEHTPAAAAHEHILFAPDRSLSAEAQALLDASALRLSIERVPGGSGTAWEQWHLRKALRHVRPDVLFCPAYTAPLFTRLPLVLTIHDVSFAAHPEWYPARTRIRRRILTTLAARQARVVLTDAEFSRREIVRLLGVSAARVRVIPLALTAPPAISSATGRPGAERGHRPVVLFVGSIFNRRHVPELIEAVTRVAQRRPDVRLEIVGDDRTHPPLDLGRAAADSGGLVTLRSYVTDAELAALYAEADVFAFLSDYEGFGLTPLEAMSNGVPVLVGDTPVAREVYGPAATYVSTTDVEAIAGRLEALLFDDRERTRLLAEVPSVLERYSWAGTASATLTAILEAARA